MTVDAISLGVFQQLFASVAEEMGLTLQRASFSPNIRERLDFSCAVFDAQARLVAQAAHMKPRMVACSTDVRVRMVCVASSCRCAGDGAGERAARIGAPQRRLGTVEGEPGCGDAILRWN